MVLLFSLFMQIIKNKWFQEWPHGSVAALPFCQGLGVPSCPCLMTSPPLCPPITLWYPSHFLAFTIAQLTFSLLFYTIPVSFNPVVLHLYLNFFLIIGHHIAQSPTLWLSWVTVKPERKTWENWKNSSLRTTLLGKKDKAYKQKKLIKFKRRC